MSDPEPPVIPEDDTGSGIPKIADEPSPESAAMEAVKLASQVVDIDTPSGAVVAAAAATTAAREAQRKRAQTEPAAASSPSLPRATSEGTTEPAASASMSAQAGEDPEFDPVQIAAQAINRLRRRAQTDLAAMRGQYNRHDVLVVLLAFVLIVVAGRVHANLVTPPTTTFSQNGLSFERSTTWLPAEPIANVPPRILRDTNPLPSATAPKSDATFTHVELTSSLDPAARIEVLIDRTAWSNVVTTLDLQRRSRWGELYTMDSSDVAHIEGHDWLRTAYRFAHAAQKGDVPRIESAIEYATRDVKDGVQILYVVTLFGSPPELAKIEEVVAPSLRVTGAVGTQIASQSSPLSHLTYPNTVERAFESTVMVVVADLVDGRLVPKGGGSGVIVGGDGSVLTNYHVLHDAEDHLHDVFVIGRFAARDHAPQLVCAGKPSRGKLQKDTDLALVKCDMDLDGRSWNPQTGPGVWAQIPEGKSSDVKVGQHLWVLGYPDVGGGGLTLTTGNVTGWTGVDGATGKDYIKTDAQITNGSSGGPVVDDNGKLIGIASAYRVKQDAAGKPIAITARLIRPLSTASDLLAIASAGWTPREGHTEVELTPSAIEAPVEGGVRLSTTIRDSATERPIAEALLEILRPGATYDVNRRDDLVLSWGKSNSAGEVMLKQSVQPGTYTVIVTANGYEPLIGYNSLTVTPKMMPAYDPWDTIWLRSR